MKLRTSGARFKTSEKCIHALYEKSLLIAKRKKKTSYCWRNFD